MCTWEGSSFFLGGEGGVGIDFLIFSCSHYISNSQVRNMFPRMTSIAPHLDIVWFAQSSPLLTYIEKPKGSHYVFA